MKGPPCADGRSALASPHERPSIERSILAHRAASLTVDGKGLAELLREEGLADDELLAAAQRRARRHAVAFVVALVDEGRPSEAQLTEMLVRRLRLPRVDPATVFIEVDAVREVAYDLAAARCILPFALERQAGRRVLRLAMADPLDRETVEEIESSTGCRIEIAIAGPSELMPAIERSYRGVVTKLIPRGQAASVGRTKEDIVTQPQYRVEDGAPMGLRVRALVDVLVEKGVLSEDEYAESLRRLLRRETDG